MRRGRVFADQFQAGDHEHQPKRLQDHRRGEADPECGAGDGAQENGRGIERQPELRPKETGRPGDGCYGLARAMEHLNRRRRLTGPTCHLPQPLAHGGYLAAASRISPEWQDKSAKDLSRAVAYCCGTDLLVPRMKACISSRVSTPSLLASIALKIRS